MYKVLLVDDEILLLDSLEIILSFNNMEVIGKATDGNAALRLLDCAAVNRDRGEPDGVCFEKAPANICDIALVDINMKGMGGIELIKILKEKYADIKILVLTTFYDDKYITEAIAGGADGYLLKDSGKDAILSAVAQILGGVTVLDQKVMARLTELMAANLAQGREQSIDTRSDADGCSVYDTASDFYVELTGREKEICSLMTEGLTNRQIADRLYISEGTVKNYISNIYDKTGIHDRVKLIVELKK